MKYQKSSSFLAIILSLLIVAMSVHATTLPTTITPDNLVLRDQYGKIVATSLNVALINNTDGYVQLARVLTESGTTFPTSPAVGYLYYRTDLQALYIYTGITWVTAMTATLPPGTISYNDLSDKPDMGVFLLENGTNVLTSNWNVGSYGIYGLTYVTSTLLTTSLLNVTSNFYGAGSFWWNNQNRTDVLANPTSPYSYIIDVSGSTYRMKNGSDGQISYQSTNVTRVEQFALGNMTFGTLYLKQVQHNSSLTVPANVMVIEDYQGVLTYRTASMAQHIPACQTSVNSTFTLTSDTSEHTIVTLTPTGVEQVTNFYLDLSELTQNCTLKVWYTMGGSFKEVTSMTLTVAAGSAILTLKDHVIDQPWKLTIQSTVAEGASRDIPYEYFVDVY